MDLYYDAMNFPSQLTLPGQVDLGFDFTEAMSSADGRKLGISLGSKQCTKGRATYVFCGLLLLEHVLPILKVLRFSIPLAGPRMSIIDLMRTFGESLGLAGSSSVMLKSSEDTLRYDQARVSYMVAKHFLTTCQ